MLPEWYERQCGKARQDKAKNENGEKEVCECRDGKTCADVIIVDPPRKGCDQKLLDTIVRIKPERLVYVSCNSATLARDLNYLCREGFVLEKVQPVDMFAMTVGVECVALLTFIE